MFNKSNKMLSNTIVLQVIIVVRGPKSNQKVLKNKILRLLQENIPGLHFSALQRKLGIGSPNTLSKALKALRPRVRTRRQPGPGIPRSVYYIANPVKTKFELERDEILERIRAAPFETADEIKTLREEIQELRFAVRMLQDASGLKAIIGGKEVTEDKDSKERKT